MTPLPSPHHDGLHSRRLVGPLVGVMAELVLVAALAYAAWGDQRADYRPLSLEDGLTMIALFGGMGAVLVFAAAASIAVTRQWWGWVLATVLLFGAGIVGFVGFFLTSIGRQEISDC